MHILVTRPQPFTKETSHFLRSQGHTVTEAPLLDITYHPFPETYPLTPQIKLVVTSYQALQVPGIEKLKRFPLWGVGASHIFRQHGWLCEQAFSNVQKLKVAIPPSYPWLYIRGHHITQSLNMPTINEHIGYTATPIKAWPIPIDWKNIDAVLLMSPKTAQTFLSLTSTSITQNLIALCHRQSVIDVINHWPWKEIKTSNVIAI